MRSALLILISSLFVLPLQAEDNWFKSNAHLELSVSAGDDGIGFEAGLPLGQMLRVRTGYSFMPHLKVPATFGVQVGEKKEDRYDGNGNRLETRFDKLSKMLYDFTGYNVDDRVDMIITPTYKNFKFLIDVFPFKDKNWYVTAGFYAGPSRFARADNSVIDAPTLIAAGMYNNMYINCYYQEPIMFGVELTPEYRNKILNWGRMGMHVGDFKGQYREDGSPVPFILEPDVDGMVHVEMKVNRFKPYVGFGYGRTIDKASKWRVSGDCGVLFWGGTPNLYSNSSSVVNEDGAPVYTIDGTTPLSQDEYWAWTDPDLEYEDFEDFPMLQSFLDQGIEQGSQIERMKHRVNLTKDVEHIGGKPGRYVNLCSMLKVMPVLNFRITYTIF